MIDLRLMTGDRLGLPYRSLMSVTFDPSTVLALQFGVHTVTIQGRNLTPIYDGQMRKVLPCAHGGSKRYECDVLEAGTFISEIEITKAMP
jgi:hypothetical protein